jgi:hypothetical protein
MHPHTTEVMTQPRLHIRPGLSIQRGPAARIDDIKHRGALLISQQRANTGVAHRTLQTQQPSRAQRIGSTSRRCAIRHTQVLRV